MIEEPSAALMAERLAEVLDFFSIGTNDLTQYVMAGERGNPSLADMQDVLQLAVLRMTKTTLDGTKPRQRHIGVCGDSASDPLAAAILGGFGIRSLGARPKQVAEIKALFRDVKMTDLEDLAPKALKCQNAT